MVGLIGRFGEVGKNKLVSVSYTHLRAHETPEHLVCRLLLEKKNFLLSVFDKKSVAFLTSQLGRLITNVGT